MKGDTNKTDAHLFSEATSCYIRSSTVQNLISCRFPVNTAKCLLFKTEMDVGKGGLPPASSPQNGRQKAVCCPSVGTPPSDLEVLLSSQWVPLAALQGVVNLFDGHSVHGLHHLRRAERHRDYFNPLDEVSCRTNI